jgi:hypothetical protein
MRFRLAFWMRDHPHALPGDVVDVPDDQVPALVKAGIGHVEPPEPLPEPAPLPEPEEESFVPYTAAQ